MALPSTLAPGSGYTQGRFPDFVDPQNRFGEFPAFTYSHNSGPLFKTPTSHDLAQRQQRDEILAAYFGKSSKPDTNDPYDYYDVENYQLPDGFLGKRPMLKYIIITGISESDQYPYRHMLPFKKEDGTQEIFWDVWRFNNHTLGRTPEESVSRMLTMNVTQGRESMIRWGIALMLEHGFYLTPKGQLNYRKNLEQITYAAATTLSYGAMFACLTAFFIDPNDQYRKKQTRGLQQIAEVLREEIDNWGILHKSADGWKIVYEKAREKLMQRNNNPGDYTVVPVGTRKFLEGKPENNYFMYNGVGYINPMPAKNVIRESVGYRMNEHGPLDDPCIRERTIGGFWWLPVRITTDPTKFDYNKVVIDVYNEGTDDYSRLSFKEDMMPYFGLWDKSVKMRLSKYGQKYFAEMGIQTFNDLASKAGVLDAVLTQINNLKPEKRAELLSIVANSVSGGGSNSNSRNNASGGGSSSTSRNRGVTFGSGVSGTRTQQQHGADGRDNNREMSAEESAAVIIASVKKVGSEVKATFVEASPDLTADYAASQQQMNRIIGELKEKAMHTSNMEDIAVAQMALAMKAWYEDKKYKEQVSHLLHSKLTLLDLIQEARRAPSAAIANYHKLKPVEQIILQQIQPLHEQDGWLALGYLKKTYDVRPEERTTNHHSFTFTPLETLLKDRRRDRNATITDSEIQNAATIGPKLSLAHRKEDKQKLELFIHFHDVSASEPVPYVSAEFTLTSAFEVLFKVYDEDVKFLEETQGKITINDPSKTLKHGLRGDWLQVSFAMSVVYFIIHKSIYEKWRSTPTDDREKVIKEAFEIAVKVCPVTGTDPNGGGQLHYRRSLAHPLRPVQTMPSQYLLNALIKDTTIFVCAAGTNPYNTDPDNKQFLWEQFHALYTQYTLLITGMKYILPENRFTSGIPSLGFSVLKGDVDKLTNDFIHAYIDNFVEADARDTAMTQLQREETNVFEQAKTTVTKVFNLLLKEFAADARKLQSEMESMQATAVDLYRVVKMSSVAESHKQDLSETAIKAYMLLVINKGDFKDVADSDVWKELSADERAARFAKAFSDLVMEGKKFLSTSIKQRDSLVKEVFDSKRIVTHSMLMAETENKAMEVIDAMAAKSRSNRYTTVWYKPYEGMPLVTIAKRSKEMFTDMSYSQFLETAKLIIACTCDVTKAVSVFDDLVRLTNGKEYYKPKTDIANMKKGDELSIIILLMCKLLVGESPSSPILTRLSSLNINVDVNMQNWWGSQKLAIIYLYLLALATTVTSVGTNDIQTLLQAELHAVNKELHYTIVPNISHDDLAANILDAMKSFVNDLRVYPSNIDMIEKRMPTNIPLEEEKEVSSAFKDEIPTLLPTLSIGNGLIMKFFVDNNIGPFFDVLAFRPHKRYMMGTMIHMNAYGKAGYTYYGWADFQLSDNVAQKTHYGHFTMYAKSIVMFPEFIVRVDNVLCKRYIGGNDVATWDPLDEEDRDNYRTNELTKAQFLIPILKGSWKPSPDAHFMDITTRFNERLYPDAQAKKATDYGPIGRIMGELWGWRSISSPANKGYFDNFAPKFNTLVFREHTRIYNQETKTEEITMDSGHWGKQVYPGCGRVRRGEEMYFKDVDYDSTRPRVVLAM